MQKVREAERDRQYQEYKDRIGEIVNGIVKRVEYGNVVVDLGRGEAIVRRDELLPREMFRNGDRIRAYIYDVRREPRGPQIFLSRTHPQFMAKLFAQEVPEIYDGIVEVKAVARDPGSRAKIAVISRDSSVDPVGACVGMRGSRVQAVVNELQGEKIDIIPWSADVATFVVNALRPAEVAKVVLDEERERIEVVVPDQQLSLAIGRRGQNVRLASQLTGWDIDILTEQEESERRQAEFEKRTKMFMEALNVDEVVGQLLASEGFNSVEELAMVDQKDIASIEGFDEETASEMQARASDYLAAGRGRVRRQAHRARRRGRAARGPRRHHQDDGRVRRERHQDRRGSRRLRHRRSRRLDRAQGRRGRPQRRASSTASSCRREECEALIMQARVKAGWITEADLAPPGDRGGTRRSSGRGRIAGRTQRLGGSSGHAGRAARPRARRCRRAVPRDAASATTRLCVATRTVRPVEELIRFVAGPDGAGARPQAPAAGPRRLGHGARRSDVEAAVKRQAFQQSLRARRAGSGRTSPTWSRGCSSARRSMRSSIAHKASLVGHGIHQGRGGDRRAPVVALHPGARCRRGRRRASSRRRWRGAARRTVATEIVIVVHHRAIGFGIGPPKCGTCSAAGRAGRRNVSRALANSRTFSSG